MDPTAIFSSTPEVHEEPDSQSSLYHPVARELAEQTTQALFDLLSKARDQKTILRIRVIQK